MPIPSGQAFSGWVHWWIWRTHWKGWIDRWDCHCHEILVRPWPFHPDSHCVDVGGTPEGRPTFGLVYSSKGGGLDMCSQRTVPSSQDHFDNYCLKLHRYSQRCWRVQLLGWTKVSLIMHLCFSDCLLSFSFNVWVRMTLPMCLSFNVCVWV